MKMADQQVTGNYPNSSNLTKEVQKVEGKMDNLLEEFWFFDNLLLKKTRSSSKSNSSSSSSNQQESAPTVSEVYAQIIKQQSLTTALETGEEGAVTDKRIRKHKNRTSLKKTDHGLNRTPSLPVNMKMEMKHSCQESVPTKASLTPNPNPLRKGNMKGRISRTESLNLESVNEMRNYYKKNQTRKTASDLEYEELQGFKDLGFNFDASNISPSVASILPGLQDKKNSMSNIDESEEDDVNDIRRNPYLSEAWELQRSYSSVSDWVVKKSSEDMKAQLKSWARTVASNVR